MISRGGNKTMKDERHVRQRRAAGARWRPAAILLAAVLVFLSLPLAGKAADVTSSVPNGSLKVAPGNDQLVQDLANANVQIDIYRIGDAKPVSGYDTYEFTATQPFGSMTILNSPDTTNEQWTALAQEAAGIVLGKTNETEWDPSPTASGVQDPSKGVFTTMPVTYSTTGNGDKSNIAANFENLPAGMYLILAHGDTVSIPKYAKKTDDGSVVTIARSPHYEYTFRPELITIPTKAAETWEGETEERINTANRGPWIFNVAVALKPEQTEMKGNLEITKNLANYEEHEITSLEGETRQVADDATFVFKVTGYLSKENYESANPTVTYEGYVSLVFNGASSRTALVSGLPVGTYIVVEEVYSGKKYTMDGDKTTVIEANQTVEVEFDNEYDDKPGGGGSVTNKFSYDENSGWQLKQGTPDNSEDAGEGATVKPAPTSGN